MFVPAKTILEALKAKLDALQWTPEPTVEVPEPAPEAAFHQVKFYSSPNLIVALQDLLMFKARVCIIVPGGDDYENASKGLAMDTACARRVFVVFSDRDFGKRQNASTGDANNPGVLELNRLVVDALLGSGLGQLNARVKIVNGTPVILTNSERDSATGREAWNLELLVESGDARTVR